MPIKHIIPTGVILGALIFLMPSNFIVIVLLLFTLRVFYNLIPSEDRRFIFRAATAGFIFRVVIIFFYYYCYLRAGHTDVLGPDGETYSQHGWYISRLLTGGNPLAVPNHTERIFTGPGHYADVVEFFGGKLPPMGLYQSGAFTYLIGVIYAAFGYNPLAIKLINAAFSILTGILLYFIGREMFCAAIGRWSMAVLVFLPSFVIFSITAMRDTIAIFMITLMVCLMIKFQESKNKIYPVAAGVLAFATEPLRSAIKYPLLALIALLMLLNLRFGIIKKFIITVFACVMIFSFTPAGQVLKNRLDPNVFFSIHLGYINTPGHNYKIFPERCYGGNKFIGLGPLEIAGGVIKGMFHLLFEPLPMRVTGMLSPPAILQTILLCLLIPFIIIGVITGLRYRFHRVIPAVAYLAIFIPLLAVTEGNIGTVFRHRDMLMPFLIVFGIAGLYTKIGNKSPL